MNKEVTPKVVHSLILKIWGRKEKRGYCWVLAHFGASRLEFMSAGQLGDIYQCLMSKNNRTVCLIHNRTHDGIKK